MDRTVTDTNFEGSDKAPDNRDNLVRREWVKPVLERLSLNGAFTIEKGDGSDGPTGGSTS